jgi:hypothetical protein
VTPVDEVYTHDFTDAMGKAYTDPLLTNDPMAVLGPGKFGLWGGEVFSSYSVQYYYSYSPALSDQGYIYYVFMNQKPAQIIPGYHFEDVNMNGEVRYHGKVNDRFLIWENNTLTGPGWVQIDCHVPFTP